MLASGTATITLTVKVEAAAGHEVTDSARVSATPFDPDTANNTATAKTKVTKITPWRRHFACRVGTPANAMEGGL